MLVWYKSSALTRRRDKHTPARTNKLQENERKSNASFAADPLGESTQFFFDSPKFSFYTLNVNCYFTNGECVRFFSAFRLAQRQHLSSIFVLRTFVCLFLAFYPSPRWNTRPRFFRLILAHFCAFPILQPFFLFFDDNFPQMVVRRVLVLIQVAYMRAHTRKNRKIDLGVYLSLIQVGLFSYTQKMAFGT